MLFDLLLPVGQWVYDKSRVRKNASSRAQRAQIRDVSGIRVRHNGKTKVKPSRLLLTYKQNRAHPRQYVRGYLHRKRCALPSRQVIPSFFTFLLAFPSPAELRSSLFTLHSSVGFSFGRRFSILHLLRVYFGLSPDCFLRGVRASVS